jgi:hypothetical protein
MGKSESRSYCLKAQFGQEVRQRTSDWEVLFNVGQKGIENVKSDGVGQYSALLLGIMPTASDRQCTATCKINFNATALRRGSLPKRMKYSRNERSSKGFVRPHLS